MSKAKYEVKLHGVVIGIAKTLADALAQYEKAITAEQ